MNKRIGHAAASAGVAIGFTAAALAAVGIHFTNKIMHIKKKSEESIIERESTERRFFTLDELITVKKETFTLDSPYGYPINGWFIPAVPENRNRFMIFCHGVTVNRLTSIKYAKLFLKRGFNAILYDARRHGKSGGKTTSYGYYEKYDLAAVVRWVKERFGQKILLGIHGESMGAATLLQYAGLVEDGADFYIADCPFSDFSEQLLHILKRDHHLPRWPILSIARLFLKIRDGYSPDEASPRLGIRNIDHPVLFIHSRNDTYVPVRMTEELYREKPDRKMLFLAENGGHACSYPDNPQAYEQALDRFLEKFVLNASMKTHA